MNKKQIEKLALVIALAYESDDTDHRKKTLENVREYFRLLFDLYIVDDMRKVEKIRSQVWNRAAELYMDHKNAAA